MNLKATIILAALVALGGLVWLLIPGSQTDVAAGPTLQFLEKELTPGAVKHIEIVRGDRKVVLDQSGPEEWSLPGKWPVRANEVKELVSNLTGLRSRFTPIALGEKPRLKEYGLDPPALEVKVVVDGKDHKLAF